MVNLNTNVVGASGLGGIGGGTEIGATEGVDKTKTEGLVVTGNANPAVADAASEAGAPHSIDDVEPTCVKSAQVILESNLEELIERLRNEEIQIQADNAAKRSEAQKGTIKAKRDQQISKIAENLKKIDDANAKQRRMRIFGWLLAGLSVLLAAVTGGLAAGIAAVAVTGTMIALQETGTMDKLAKAIENSLVKNGCSEKTAKILSMVFTSLITIAGSVAGGLAGTAVANAIGRAATKAAQEAIKAAIKESAKKAVEEAVKKTAETATKEAIQQAVSKAVKEAVETSVQQVIKDSVSTATKVVLKSGVESAAKKAAEEAVKEVLESVAKNATSQIVKAAVTEAASEIVKQAGAIAGQALTNALLQTVQKVGSGVQYGGQAAMIGASVDLALKQYKIKMSEADLQALKAFLAKLQQMLEENNDDLERLVQLLQESLANVAKMLGDVDENKIQLNNQMANMA